MTKEQLDQALNVVAEISRIERDLHRAEKTLKMAIDCGSRTSFTLNMAGMITDETRVSRPALIVALQSDIQELTLALDQAKLEPENL